MECYIPKKLFMIWLGDKVPNYVNLSAKAFQRVNPDFAFELIHRTVQDLEDIWTGKLEDKPLKRALNRVLVNEDPYTKWQREFYGYKPSFLQLLADIARIEVLNKYGGIYVDCDTFPIARFDDALLNNKYFCVKRRGSVGMNCFLDNFFIGKSNDANYIEDPYSVANSFLVDHTERYESTPKYYLLRRKFFNGQLMVGEHVLPNKCYIDHYSSRTRTQIEDSNVERWFDKLWRK